MPGRFRRALRRLASLIQPQPVYFVYSGQYTLEVPGLPADPRRGENIITFLAMERLLKAGRLRWPREASIRSLQRVHSPAYLEALLERGALTPILGLNVSEADEDRYLHLQRAMVGGTVLATRLALAGCVPVVNLGGGLHHAHRDRGEGFCAFNDVAVAIAQAREAGFAERVLVIDLDLHDGNGTRSIFAADPTVYTFSIHNQTWAEAVGGGGPGGDAPNAVASTCLALGDKVDDGRYLAAIEEHLPPVIDSFRPGLVYYLAGTDPAATDALGNWKISNEGMVARDQLVMSRLRSRLGDLPLVTLLAGGYGTEAWRYSARFFAWLLSGGRAIEPPSTSEITLQRYRYLASLVEASELSAEPTAGDDLGLTEADLLPGTSLQAKPSRLLGFYSANGLELALERYGFLARLRALGFARPRLVIELENPGGDTLKIYGSESDDDLLLELRVRRDARLLPGCELLAVEWLLLQNPRAVFPPDRPPLPGQKHPGLGLLREVIALLVLACDRLSLDGIAFTPAHFHVAAQSERFVEFLRPEDGARFRALRQAVTGLPLAAASRAIAEGRVTDEASDEPVAWQPAPMVIAVSERMKEALAAQAREAPPEPALRLVATDPLRNSGGAPA